MRLRSESEKCGGILGAVYAEGLEQERCPVCYLVSISEARYAEALLYENVLDPGVRVRFIESLGLCASHAWLLLDTAEKLYDRLGVSILYLDALKSSLESLDRLVEGDKDPSERCFMCRYSEDAEDRYVKLYRECLKPEDYRRSGAVFCLKHLRSILRIRGEAERKQILEIHREKLGKIVENLERYIAKHSYDNKEPITKGEAKAAEQAIASLKGLRTHINIVGRHVERKEPIARRTVSMLSNIYREIFKHPPTAREKK
ncbi:MAG: hypothetical protein QXX84_08905 [Sulfolobales archaeon]